MTGTGSPLFGASHPPEAVPGIHEPEALTEPGALPLRGRDARHRLEELD